MHGWSPPQAPRGRAHEEWGSGSPWEPCGARRESQRCSFPGAPCSAEGALSPRELGQRRVGRLSPQSVVQEASLGFCELLVGTSAWEFCGFWQRVLVSG